MDIRSVLRELFGPAAPGELVEVRRVPAQGTLPRWINPHDPHGLPEPEELQNGASWYFGVFPRTATQEVKSGVLVYADIDAKADITLPDPASIFPRPTLAVSSGGGLHVYWTLSKPVEPSHALRLSRLATLLLNGDRRVLEPHRVMRLPGSVNHKYTPPVPCEVCFHGKVPPWEPEELEDSLVAAIASKYWVGGDRHALALALGAVLARTGWDAERVERTADLVCDFSGDDERIDRKVAMAGTVKRYAEGRQVSSREWRSALGDATFKEFLAGLGLTARDGNLVYHGEVVGTVQQLESSLVNTFLADENWAAGDGLFYYWNGDRWLQSSEKTLRAHLFDFIQTVYQVEMGEEIALMSTNKLASALQTVVEGKLLESPLPPPPAALLPTLNGVLDPETRTLRESRKEDYFRWRLQVKYDPEATCPTWIKFLEYAAPEEISLLQEWVGYCLTPGNPWQYMLWLHGATGTGKSKFVDTVSALFGDARTAIKTESFNDYTIASLANAMIATCTEMSNKMLRTSLLKALVAGDAVAGRHPYGRPFVITFQGKFLWSSNVLPPVDQAEGLWRRLIVVPFERSPEKLNVTLAADLAAELPGIFNWALDGLDRVREYTKNSHWPKPPSVTGLLREYRDSADTFAQFVADEIDIGPEYTVPAKELYFRYAQWGREHGHRLEPMGPIFRKEMRRFGVRPREKPDIINGRPTMLWEGGRLRPDVFSGSV